MKYRPEYPENPFIDLPPARDWVQGFVQWYNQEHLHSSIKFVTPEQRHTGQEEAILAHRQQVYQAAKARHPNRWSGRTRNWDPITEVYLNPEKVESNSEVRGAA